ncbi:MAG: hypothetical protein KUG79_07345 [Pseudomonadales bacterium]|nr:hypothetical protein [Pseudomonadales bacterium]
MAKRRITLTSQEMNEINSRTKTLESQLSRSNARVDELESGLVFIKNFISEEAEPQDLENFITEMSKLVDRAINPPVAAKEVAAKEVAAKEVAAKEVAAKENA